MEAHQMKERQQYRQARKRYSSMVKRAKLEAWLKFVIEKGRKDTWRITYKVVMGKMKREIFICTIRF